MSVIERDFGKKQRQLIRRFRQLLALDALHEANIKANPVPYLERASERIYQLERALFEAARTATVPAGDTSTPREQIRVDRLEYEALRRCLARVEEGLGECSGNADSEWEG